MKDLNDQAVIDVAKDLIAKNGSTTTLDIKNELRDQGYFATQNQVSAMMFNNFQSAGLEFSVAGGHREYVESTTSTAPSTDATDTVTVQDGNEKADAIALCEANGLTYASSQAQINHGTLYFTDPLVPEEGYSITKTGYARRHFTAHGPYNYGPQMYQLNKRVKSGNTIKRLLLPGQYLKLAEVVVRIAKNHRP